MNESMEILPLILEATIVVKAVMATLLFLSVVCWGIVLYLWLNFGKNKRADNKFLQMFYNSDSISQLYQKSKNNVSNSHMHKLFFDGVQEFALLNNGKKNTKELIEASQRQMRIGIQKQQIELETGLSMLASIGSVAPYIGLFGTVWGIMHSFLGLSQTQQASIATVAPGIAEALIATAMGLFAAIPAVLAFNHFSHKSEKVYQNKAIFCEEVTALLNQESGK